MERVDRGTARRIGNLMKLDWGKYELEEFRRGLEVEQEHEGESRLLARIVVDHLNEDPHYYSELDRWEKGKEQGEVDWKSQTYR